VSAQGRIALAVVALVAVLAGGWFVVVAPKRADIAVVQTQIADADKRRATAEAALADAERLRAQARKDGAMAARLSKAVPDDDNVGALIRQLDAIAQANKIDFRAMKLVSAGEPAPQAAAPATPAGENPADGETPAEGEKPAAGAATAADAPVAATVAQPPPGAAVGPAGLLTVPFSFTFDGGYLAMQRFLGAIDDLAENRNGHLKVRGRLITVDGFSLAASRDGFPKVKALVSATAYLAPDPPAASAAPAGAAAAADPMAGGGAG